MKRFARSSVAAVALAPLAALACSLVTDLDSLRGSEGTDAGANLVTNASFDDGAGGCGLAWTIANATMQRSTTSHSGTYSCEVCPTGTAPPQLTQTTAVAGTSLFMQAWINQPSDDASSPAKSVNLALYAFDDAGVQQPYMSGSAVDPSSTSSWQLLQLTAPYGSPIASVQATITSQAPGCFLVDDVSLISQ